VAAGESNVAAPVALSMVGQTRAKAMRAPLPSKNNGLEKAALTAAAGRSADVKIIT
jgi:hypothetical protein